MFTMATKSPININSATEEELMTLHHISKKWAKAIMDTCKQLGGSMTVDDFKATLDRTRCHHLGPPAAARHDH